MTLLGPFSVSDGDAPLSLGRGIERALVALLALHANEPLSVDRIIDGLWGERPPPTARDMVRVYVGRARTCVGDALVTSGGGYMLRVNEERVDRSRFESLRQEGLDALAGGDPRSAAVHLGKALSLWHGRPLAEFEELPFARDEILRLRELRLSTIEEHVDAQLVTGRSAELVPTLERLVAEEPYRERLRGQLMLALYRGGRQTDALECYRDGRRLLAEEIGVEPGPQLRELERAILRHDPALDDTPSSTETTEATAGAGKPRRYRLIRPVLIAAILVAVALSLIFFLPNNGRSVSLGAHSVGAVDPHSGKLITTLSLPGTPVDLAATGSHLWIALGEPHAVSELDPRTNRLVRTVTVENVPRRIVGVPGGIWIALDYAGTIARFGDEAPAPDPPVRVFPPARVSFAAKGSAFWAASSPSGTLARLEARTGRVLSRLDVAQPIATAVGYGAVWLASSTRAVLQRVVGRSQVTIPIGSIPADVAAGEGAVWVVTPEDGKLWRIDPERQDVSGAVSVGATPTFVATGGGSVWIASHSTGTLTRLDLRTNEVVQTILLGRPISGLAFAFGRIWVTST